MYYKAILHERPKVKFEVVEITEKEAIGYTQSIYSHIGNGVYSKFAIRKTKNSAINALKKSLSDTIKTHEREIEELKKSIKSYGEIGYE